jgi:hypothetical protein
MTKAKSWQVTDEFLERVESLLLNRKILIRRRMAASKNSSVAYGWSGEEILLTSLRFEF